MCIHIRVRVREKEKERENRNQIALINNDHKIDIEKIIDLLLQ